jgi:hypothetical protein
MNYNFIQNLYNHHNINYNLYYPKEGGMKTEDQGSNKLFVNPIQNENQNTDENNDHNEKENENDTVSI